MKTTLNLKKDDLLGKLEDRVTEIREDFDKQRAEIQAVIDERESAGSSIEAHAEYYTGLAEGLRDGSITLNTRTGKLSGAGPKPGTKGYSGTSKHVRPKRGGWGWYSNEQLEGQLERLTAREEETVKPVQTAIDLLNLATDETVEIDTTDYHDLLNGNGNWRW